jgi:hypothetical protein
MSEGAMEKIMPLGVGCVELSLSVGESMGPLL